MPAPTPIIILIKAGAASYDPPCRSVGDAAASLSIIRGPGLRLIGLGVVCMWVWVFLVVARSVCNAAVLVGRQVGTGAAERESRKPNATGDDRGTQVDVYQLAVELDLTWLWTSCSCIPPGALDKWLWMWISSGCGPQVAVDISCPKSCQT